MFEFRYVELMNWAYWPTVKLPLDQQTIMISGPNGSGKTTFLDALRVLLRAPRLSSNRRFTDYIIGNVSNAAIRGVVSNPEMEGGRRPFEFMGILSEEVTLAVLLRNKSGKWERRYAILAGDVPLEQLQTLSRADQLAPQSYSYQIQEAGFSDALLKVLALEQGQTDKLCEKSPRELLDLLLDVHGDKEIIERYKRARENYQTAALEVSQLGARLAEEQARVMTAQRAAEAYQRYKRLCDEKENFENVLMPQAEFKNAQLTIGEANLAIADLNLRLQPMDREIIEVQARLENADTELQALKRKVEDARLTKGKLEQTERDLDIQLNTMINERRRLDETLKTAGKVKAVPVEPLRKKLEDVRREMARVDLQIEERAKKRDELQRELAGMEDTSRKFYPMQVNEFRKVLERNGVPFDLLCDILDVTDKDWQLAVESLLGRDRFTVLVDAGDQRKARQLAEKFRYRGYIVDRDAGMVQAQIPSAPRDSALEVVDVLDDGVPKWVVDNLGRTILVESVADGMKLRGDVTVTRQGYRQDRRGGISIAVDRFYCGSLGQSALREETERELDAVHDQLVVLDKVFADKEAQANDLERQIQVQEARERAGNAEAEKAAISEKITKINTEHKQALQARRESEHKLLATLEDLNNFEHECAERRRWLLEQKRGQSDSLTELEDLQKSIDKSRRTIARVEEALDAALLTDKALRDVKDEDELSPRYYAVQALLEEYVEPPDEAAVHVYEHHNKQFEEQQKLYSDHEAGLRNWHNEFHQARHKYVVVVEHTIREYRRNVLALAELAGVDADIQLPNLHEAEDSLDTAELQVRFGYDGKGVSDVRGVSHSGGQRVISSLILLMALATSGGRTTGGFFIIDEPFAHLSIERIDDVTRFLVKTQCQFILTSPTTHNVNVFSAARLQMNFRIKRPGAQFAPIPTIIRR